MNKGTAMKEVNKKLNINLNSNNTNWTNINSNGIWSIEPNCDKKVKKLYLLLHNKRSNKIHVFEIPANHSVYNELYSNNTIVYRLLFEVNDTNFIETLRHIDFKNFYLDIIDYA